MENNISNFEYLKDLWKRLSVKTDYHWKANNSVGANHILCLTYIDKDIAAKLLSENCVWERKHRVINDSLFCGISVQLPDGKWITRWDCGSESNQEKEKGVSSDSFKRAAKMFGVGAFTSDIPKIILPAKQNKKGKLMPVDDNGNFLYGDKLDQACEARLRLNGKNNNGQQSPKVKSFTKAMFDKGLVKITNQVADLGHQVVIDAFVGAFDVIETLALKGILSIEIPDNITNTLVVEENADKIIEFLNDGKSTSDIIASLEKKYGKATDGAKKRVEEYADLVGENNKEAAKAA